MADSDSVTTDEPGTRPRGVLGVIERVGNRLPDPLTLFLAIGAGIVALSSIGSLAGWSVEHPGTGEQVPVESLVSQDGLVRMLSEFTDNVGSFFPLIGGIVIMIGIALVERTGLAQAVLKRIALAVPTKGLTLAVIALGLISSIASDVGFILLPPIAGMLFYIAGRHPVAGIVIAYAAVAAGFQANVLVGIVEVIGFGFAEQAAQVIDPGMSIGILSNYYFTLVSALVLPVVGYVVAEKVIIPRMGPYTATDLADGVPDTQEAAAVNDAERRGLRGAGITAVLLAALVVVLVAFPWSPLREPDTGSVLDGPFMVASTQVVVVTVLLAVPSLVFGITTRAVRSDSDVAKMITDGMATFGPYILLAVVASQVIAYFAWTNLGVVTAVNGAQALESLGLPPIVLLVAFVLFVAVLNLVMASAAAKWALLAPIFVPMLMLLDVHPAAAFMAYRIGDSATNAITPMLAYFVIMLGFAKRWDPRIKLGTLLAALVPFSLTFLGVWLLQLVGWYLLGWPLGPGVGFGLDQ